MFVFFFLHILWEFIFTGPNFHELLESPKKFHSTRFSHPMVCSLSGKTHDNNIACRSIPNL